MKKLNCQKEFNWIRKVNINDIAPGYIKTANTAPIRADKVRNAEIQGRIPADRWADPFDLMGTIVFLAEHQIMLMDIY